jgi:hypothetical protein
VNMLVLIIKELKKKVNKFRPDSEINLNMLLHTKKQFLLFTFVITRTSIGYKDDLFNL